MTNPVEMAHFSQLQGFGVFPTGQFRIHTHTYIYIYTHTHTHFNSSKGYKPQQKVLADKIRHSHKWLQVAALGFRLGLPAGS